MTTTSIRKTQVVTILSKFPSIARDVISDFLSTYSFFFPLQGTLVSFLQKEEKNHSDISNELTEHVAKGHHCRVTLSLKIAKLALAKPTSAALLVAATWASQSPNPIDAQCSRCQAPKTDHSAAASLMNRWLHRSEEQPGARTHVPPPPGARAWSPPASLSPCCGMPPMTDGIPPRSQIRSRRRSCRSSSTHMVNQTARSRSVV